MWYRHEATLELKGPFPIDMLGFDECYPASVGDARAIDQSTDEQADWDETYKVIVVAVTQEPIELMVWSADRWKIRNVKITDMRKRKA